ncbi:hypothetical protein ACIFOE_04985 [Paenibacillus sp. NRS-1783]|uniref:hypothetical protein n=1 Tax=Paenibacillus sp. NRS-1783 TaxID=3233907 RepID=UPI003D2AD784
MNPPVLKTTVQDYVDQMKKIYAPDLNSVAGVDQILILIGGLISVMSFVAMLVWIFILLKFINQVSMATRSIKDYAFYKRMGVGLLIIFLVLTGGVTMIFSQLYDQMFHQGWLWN